jgi:hypothetical protein
VSAPTSRFRFRFSQFEFPWLLGPPDGRYLLRAADAPPGSAPTHVLVLATLGAPERRKRLQRAQRQAQPEPEPTPVSTARATVIDVGDPFADAVSAQAWLAAAGETELAADLAVLNRTLRALRLVTADPYLNLVRREQALVARIGWGAGEQVADGLWSEALELDARSGRERRLKVLQPQARLAAMMNGRERALVCEELTLRARLDLDHGHDREAALQLLVALDAALAELPGDPVADSLAERLSELRGLGDGVTAAAQAALAAPLSAEQRATVAHGLGRLEAALRARAVANA